MRVVLADLDHHLVLVGNTDCSVALHCADHGCWHDGAPIAVYNRLGTVSVHETDDAVVKTVTIGALVLAGQRHINHRHRKGGNHRR